MPVKYEHRTEYINGLRQEINILEIDLKNPKVKVRPVLSHDLIYGFEYLSKIVERSGASAAVNAGFFDVYGIPAGMTVLNGKVLTLSKGKYPSLCISNGKASFRNISSSLWIIHNGERIKVDKLNMPLEKNQAGVYTKEYGKSSRAELENLTITVRGGIIQSVGILQGEAGIPEDGMLVVFTGDELIRKFAGGYSFKAGEKIELVHEPEIPPDADIYECGNFIVKDGEIVVKR